jgi:hypothetical protein
MASKADSGEQADERQKHAACRSDFVQFCHTYFPQTTTFPLSDDHRKVLSRLVIGGIGDGFIDVDKPGADAGTTGRGGRHGRH